MYSNVTPPALPDYNPVGLYSYNGVELPEIPEVAGYQSLMIFEFDTGYALHAYKANKYISAPRYRRASLVHDESFDFPGTYKHFSLRDGSWVQTASQTKESQQAVYSDMYKNPIWTNFTFEYTTISTQETLVLCEASEPVPVLAYPYSVMVYDYEKSAEDWYQVHLYYSATPFTWNGEAVGNSGTVYKRIYDADYAVWSEEEEAEIEVSPGLEGRTFQRIYTSHDILDSSGNVWLAAGSVTEAEEIVTEKWLRSFQAGLALGLAVKPLPIKKEPLAFVSRNGDTIILMGAYKATLTDGILEVV